MNRNELVQIAHALKRVRPEPQSRAFIVYRSMRWLWNQTCESVADSLNLKDKPRSNFLAACGLLHANEDPTEPGEV